MTTQLKISRQQPVEITWEPLPPGFRLEDEPVENTGQPLIAGALRESLEIAQRIQPQMLIATNFALCATVNGELVIKAPDWLYVPSVREQLAERNSYTPNLEGDVPTIVMEFLSETEGGEYSVKPTYPPGKWLFWHQSSAILPWAVEQIEAERQRAEQESLRADREREEKEKLIAYLRAKGLDPNDIS
jgi:hypothetical protein